MAQDQKRDVNGGNDDHNAHVYKQTQTECQHMFRKFFLPSNEYSWQIQVGLEAAADPRETTDYGKKEQAFLEMKDAKDAIVRFRRCPSLQTMVRQQTVLQDKLAVPRGAFTHVHEAFSGNYLSPWGFKWFLEEERRRMARPAVARAWNLLQQCKKSAQEKWVDDETIHACSEESLAFSAAFRDEVDGCVELGDERR